MLKKIKSNKRGSEIMENILMIAVVLAVIMLVFYPQIKSACSTIMVTITNELSAIVDNIFGK